MNVDPSTRRAGTADVPAGDRPARVDLSLRPVELADATLLWQWRNDPHTIAMSRQPDVIAWETHVAWLAKRLADRDAMLLIGLQGDQSIGVVRFERRADGAAEVSITIAADFRGRGLGKPLLQSGCEYADRAGFARVFDAEIRTDNLASRKIFEASGFKFVSSDERWVVYRRQQHPDRDVR
jgi:RimJ/RimL family protein N-acetyltransferase